jgi:hypothetical protein
VTGDAGQDFFAFVPGLAGVRFFSGQPEDRAMQGCNPSAELEAGAGGPWKHGLLPFAIGWDNQ